MPLFRRSRPELTPGPRPAHQPAAPDALWQSGLDTVGAVATDVAGRPQCDLWFA